MTPPAKEDLLRRLRRIEGQTRGLQSMIESDRACGELLQQIAAVEAALGQVAVGVASDHVRDCMDVADPDERDRMTDEVIHALARVMR